MGRKSDEKVTKKCYLRGLPGASQVPDFSKSGTPRHPEAPRQVPLPPRLVAWDPARSTLGVRISGNLLERDPSARGGDPPRMALPGFFLLGHPGGVPRSRNLTNFPDSGTPATPPPPPNLSFLGGVGPPLRMSLFDPQNAKNGPFSQLFTT